MVEVFIRGTTDVLSTRVDARIVGPIKVEKRVELAFKEDTIILDAVTVDPRKVEKAFRAIPREDTNAVEVVRIAVLTEETKVDKVLTNGTITVETNAVPPAKVANTELSPVKNGTDKVET